MFRAQPLNTTSGRGQSHSCSLTALSPGSDLACFRMLAGTLLLICVMVLFSADAEDKSRLYRRPSCVGVSATQMCPLNYSPVCGSNGITYPNECSLCVHRLEKNADILIVKDGPC
ncbi:unnamed protein product [Menidia menidia]|uniref:(Atlantic silverside) hypothetical protein n=1 Tax=Menidia menidia TaxID=238744 RepID=A0A8S4BN86_9TELE|nr:unnamed protein product [Menidia menidia]